MIQFTGSPVSQSFSNNAGILNDPLFFYAIIAVVSIFIFLSFLFILRALLRFKSRQSKAFNRVVLQITVPKEKKSEGTGGQGSQEDRLEQIKEEIGLTETVFAAIAGIKPQGGISSWLRGRNDHTSFEMVMHEGLIYFYVSVPDRMHSFIEQQIHAQYPYAHIEKMSDYNIFSKNSSIVGAYLKSSAPAVFPLKTYKSMEADPLSTILNVLAKVRENNSSAAIQFTVRPANKNWRSKGVSIVREVKKGKKFEDVVSGSKFMKALKIVGQGVGEQVKSPETLQREKDKDHYQLSAMEEEMLKGIEEKISKGGMQATIRLISVSDDESTARLNLDNLINAFSQFNLYRYGASFKAIVPKTQSKLIRDFIYRSFSEKYNMILNTEEMSSLWHLPLHSTEAPNIKWLTGRKAPPPPNIPTEGLLIGFVEYRGQKTNIYMKEADRRRHMYLIGKSGGGKSVFIAKMAVQDIHNGKGVCVVDPHGDLVEYVLSHIPKERADDVIIFDPSDVERPIGLNMLEAKSEDQKDFAVQEMISIFYKLFPPEMIGPMFEHNMRNVMLTLMADLKNPGTVIDIPRMFTDDEYVKKYLAKLKDPVVRAFWEKEMAKTSDFHKSEMLGYLISKVGRFVENEMMRNIMGQQKSGFDFREVMDQNKILLVNLAKGKTGEVNAKLLGLIVVAKLQMAALARADMPEEQRDDFYLYIDEFQNFVTDSISTILSEARKYKLNLIIAHQYMGQLTDDKGRADIRDAVLGNAGTICSARIGPDDAEILAKEFAPTFGSYDLLNAPEYSWYTKMLIDNTASKPFLMQTFPPEEGSTELGSAIKELSRLKFGRDRRIVEAEIMDRTKIGQPESQGNTEAAEASL
ncbi:MAG: type IV secretion system DNA-binding domain-containing protein [Candidatus Magasanikbacteria bacterium]|nr:type IV secretion system DNA-binding domain-containing protein [Candidatus Magasanikbacteria bacterium]